MKNTKLHWQKIGNQSNPSMVLIHGWGASSKVWGTFVEALKTNYCLHLVDLPGYGDSPLTAHKETIENLADLIFQEAPKKAFWLGWSLGGLIAAQIALTHAKSVEGLITLASSPCFMANKDWLGLDANIFAKFSASLQQDRKATLKKFIALECLGDTHAKVIQKYLFNILDPNLDLLSLKWGLKQLESIDLRENLNQIRVPYLSILGREDKIVPAQINANYRNRLNHNWYVLDGAAHVPFISHMQQCIALINNFITLKNKKGL